MATAYERLSCPLNVVDVSSDQRVAAAGSTNSLLLFRIGKNVDTLQLEDTHTIRDTARMSSLKPILDLRFNPTLALPHLLATTSSSGALVVWDINHSKGSLGQWQPCHNLSGHTGSVNCVTWHYSNAHTLISGSHDTKVRLWDLRVRTGAILHLTPVKGCAIRAVQFQKIEGANKFAVALTNGNVQIWDIRHPKLPERTFKAHDIAYTLDWSPDFPDLLLSGGRDGFVKVWDTSQAIESDRAVSYKPTYAIETAEGPVVKSKWRPGHPFQLATCSGRSTKLNIWSVLQPDVPLAYLSMGENPSATGTGFVWLDQHLKQDDVLGSSLCGTQWWEWDHEESSDSASETSRFEDDEFKISNPRVVALELADSNSIAGSSVVAMDEASLERKKEMQRQRFRCFKHKHRSEEELIDGFGFMLSCTKSGYISITSIGDSLKPIEKFRPNAVHFSFTDKITSVCTLGAVEANTKALGRYKTTIPDDETQFPQISFQDMSHAEFGGNFHFEEFIQLARQYMTPRTMPENVVNVSRLEYCCKHNASVCESLKAYSLAQIWRLILVLYFPTEHVTGMSSNASVASDDSGDVWSARLLRRASSIDKISSNRSASPRSDRNWSRPGSPRNNTRPRTRSNNIYNDRASDTSSMLPSSSGRNLRTSSIKDNNKVWNEGVYSSNVSESSIDNVSDISEMESLADNNDGKAIPIDLSAWDLSDQFHTEPSLWLSSSLNILYRMNVLAPISDDVFDLSAPLMDRDKLELAQAISLAKPLELPFREAYGERRQRRLQRRTRREEYYNLNNTIYGLVDKNHSIETHIDQKHFSKPTKKSFGPFGHAKFKSKYIHSILNYHAEIGDVQTCSLIVLVLGELLVPSLDEFMIRKWLCSYIDLLQQAQEFAVAARIISTCGMPQVEKCYQMTSRIAQGCLTCSKGLGKNKKKIIIPINPNFKGKCENCASIVSRCSVCQLVVRGVYVWCQGCGHGGHLDHMEKWFENETVCPSGCGHSCRT